MSWPQSIVRRQMVTATVSCVAEPSAMMLNEAHLLFKSLRLRGGRAANSDCVLCVVGDLPGEWATRFGQIGVQISIVKPVDERCRHANKISMFRGDILSDVLLALDTDIAVARDFTDRLRTDRVVAKPVDQDPLPMESWARLWRHFGMAVPKRKYRTSFDHQTVIPYFNSGVVAIPTAMAPSLAAAWTDLTHRLLDDYPLLPDIERHRFFTDQFSLALALAKLSMPVFAENLAWNFPTHSGIDQAFDPDTIDPIFLHHHHRTTNGTVDHCVVPYRKADIAIDGVNRSLTGTYLPRTIQNDPTFNNNSFWNDRYSTDQVLGSGVGSRGVSAQYKRDILSSHFSSVGGDSILDIGCGDLELLSESRFPFKYTGIDISDVVIRRNQEKYPDLRFEAIDFGNAKDVSQFSADLVLSLDVLIHQHDWSGYVRMVQRLVAAARVGGVVSGYIARPRAAFRSKITSYHEPLTATLERVGAKYTRIIGSYRDTAMVAFER